MLSTRCWKLAVFLGLLVGVLGGCGGEDGESAADSDSQESDFDSETGSVDSESEIPSDSGGDTETTNDTEDPQDTDTESESDSHSEEDSDTETASATDVPDTDSLVDTDSEDPEEDAGVDGGEIAILELFSVLPAAASRYTETELTLAGAEFETGMIVELILGTGEQEVVIPLGEATVDEEGDFATVTLAADEERLQGLYNVRVTNPDTESATLFAALFVSALMPPSISEVEPSIVWQGSPSDQVVSDRSILISGEGFTNTPWVKWVSATDPDLVFSAIGVKFLDSESLVAVIPTESQQMPAGEYHVWVTNPDNLSGMWLDPISGEPEVFVVTENPPPMIAGIDPVQHPFNEECAPFTISGQYFQDGAEVALITPSGDQPLTIVSTTPNEIVSSIPSGVLEIGYYPVRVTNPDGRSDTFYVYEAKNPTDGHFYGDFSLLPSTLTSARERHALIAGFDEYLGTHLYATGGIDQNGVVLADGEIASVNVFGELEDWRILEQYQDADNPRVRNDFETARSGHSLVRVGKYLYAIGGSNSDTSVELNPSAPALGSVERAEILGADKTPEILSLGKTGDGNLPMGTWYYSVSAVGSFGESLASYEKQILNKGGTFSLCWSTITGATGYNIYRSTAADGRPGSGRLIANAPAEATPEESQCFVDDGSIHPAPGFLSATTESGGALAAGIWIYRVTAVVGDVESVAGYRVSVITDETNQTVRLTWNAVENATYNVYRTLGTTEEPTGIEETYLLASGQIDTEWVDDGGASPDGNLPASAGISALPIGSLCKWEMLPGDLVAPREGSAANVIFLGEEPYIYVAGGRSNGGGEDYLASVEMAKVLENGDLDMWTEMGSMKTARAFFSLVSSQPTQVSAFSSPADDDTDAPLFLFAIAGDGSFEEPPSENSGLMTIEAARVEREDGSLFDFEILGANLSEGRKTYGHGGAFIDQYLYVFPGVDTEIAGLDGDGVDYEPVPLSSKSTRFEYAPGETLSDPYTDILTGFMSSNGGLATPRSYYGTVRVNGRVFIVGGNDGLGPISSVESIPQ